MLKVYEYIIGLGILSSLSTEQILRINFTDDRSQSMHS